MLRFPISHKAEESLTLKSQKTLSTFNSELENLQQIYRDDRLSFQFKRSLFTVASKPVPPLFRSAKLQHWCAVLSQVLQSVPTNSQQSKPFVSNNFPKTPFSTFPSLSRNSISYSVPYPCPPYTLLKILQVSRPVLQLKLHSKTSREEGWHTMGKTSGFVEFK